VVSSCPLRMPSGASRPSLVVRNQVLAKANVTPIEQIGDGAPERTNVMFITHRTLHDRVTSRQENTLIR
jgi:hypothetical protein